MKNFIFLLFWLGCINNALAMSGAEFTSIKIVNDHQEDFAQLPLEDLEKYILANAEFRRDSEESIFPALMLWIKKQRQKHFPPFEPGKEDSFSTIPISEKTIFVDKYLRPLLRHINFSKMSPYYFGYIVPIYLEEYDPQIYIDLVTRSVEENTVKGQQYNSSEIKKIVPRKDSQRFGMKVEFRKLSEWKEDENKPSGEKKASLKFYSDKILYEGYNFRVFLKREKDGVAAYVNCTPDTLNDNILLPAEVMFSVVSSDDPHKVLRSFPAHISNFNHFDRSFGLYLTQKENNETYENFINGNTILTEKYETDERKLDNKINIIMEVKFLDEKSPSQNQLPLALNFNILNHNHATATASDYILAIQKRNLLVTNPADSLFHMLTHWIKAKEHKFFFGNSFKLADRAKQEEFSENYIKPIIAFIPFKTMTSAFIYNRVKDFMKHYFLEEIYADIKTSYDKMRPMDWQDSRGAWTGWQKIVSDWQEWEERKASFIKENPDKPFALPQPYFPGIANIVSTLKNDFPIDSEESILYLALNYAHERGKRINILEEPSYEEWESLWERIQWDAINKDYFSSIRNYVEQINHPVLNRFYTDEKNRRLKDYQADLGTRPKIKDAEKVMIKYIFQDVRNWQETKKYYSSSVLINGYIFEYFLRRQQISKDGEPQAFGLAGFLKAGLGPNIQEINLPLHVSFAVLLPQEKERKFSTMHVLFSGTEKAIGGKLSFDGESWEKIIHGDVPIVINNTISVIVSIDFNTHGMDKKSFLDPVKNNH